MNSGRFMYLRKVYTAPTLDAAVARFEEFTQQAEGQCV